MTTLYRPVLIESAEQAEALPEGTVATDPDVWPVEKFQGRWENDADRFDHSQMVGWSALVPIDAEVQAAKIKAWQEGVNFALPNAETTWYPQHNPYRATEYETGDQA